MVADFRDLEQLHLIKGPFRGVVGVVNEVKKEAVSLGALADVGVDRVDVLGLEINLGQIRHAIQESPMGEKQEDELLLYSLVFGLHEEQQSLLLVGGGTQFSEVDQGSQFVLLIKNLLKVEDVLDFQSLILQVEVEDGELGVFMKSQVLIYGVVLILLTWTSHVLEPERTVEFLIGFRRLSSDRLVHPVFVALLNFGEKDF